MTLVYEPSVGVMRDRFPEFDPRVPHSEAPPRSDMASPIADLVDRAPEAAGLVIETWGKISHRTQVKVLDNGAASWALQLREPGIRDALVVCRIPFGPNHESGFRIGGWAVVKGLAVAEGGVPGADDAGMFRVLYFACSHAAPLKRPVGRPR